MAVLSQAIDFNHLRRTLEELGYKEQLPLEAAPLVHHILADLNQATQQYTDLLENYDALFSKWNELSQQKSKTFPSNPPGIGNGNISFSGIDNSLLGFEGLSDTLDESFMLKTIEDTRTRNDELLNELSKAQEQIRKLLEEKTTLTNALDKNQVASQEMARLLKSKQDQHEILKNDMDNMKKNNEITFGLQVSSLLKTALSLLPDNMQPSFLSKSTDTLSSKLNLINDIIQRSKRECEGHSSSLQTTKNLLDKLKAESLASEEAMAKMRSGLSQYQNQIAELNNRLHQRDFDTSLQTDISSHLAALENVNKMLKDKVETIERIKREVVVDNSMAGVALGSMLESLSAELNTEICFSGHLNQVVEKLNKRRTEQDLTISSLQEKLSEASIKVAKMEVEKSELRIKFEKALEDASKKDSLSNANKEITTNLQQALESKEAKIDEQKKYCNELKNALDQCQLSMANMRRNEEMIRQHVAQQDEEIKSLNRQIDQFRNENNTTMQKLNEAEANIAAIKISCTEKEQENVRLSSELKSATVAQEKVLIDLKNNKRHIEELEETILAKRKGKDLLMTTYCRVIKDNEKLHSEIQKMNETFANTRAGDIQSESTIKAFQTKVQAQAQELEKLREQLSNNEAKVVDLNNQLTEAQRTKNRLDDDLLEKTKEMASLKGVVSSLERSKKDIASQMARFGQQASELRTHLKTIEAERNDLLNKLKTQSMDTPLTRDLQSQLAAVTVDFEQAKIQLRNLEREKESLSQQLQLSKIKSERMEQMMLQERTKRMEGEVLVQSLESARTKLKEQLEMLNEEHEKSLNSMKKQMRSIREDYDRSKRNPKSFDHEFDTFNSRNSHIKREIPLPNSPVDNSLRSRVADETEKLLAQNRYMKKQLADIQKEMKETLSPVKYLSGDLDTSIIALTNEYSPPSGLSSEDIEISNADLKKRLEQENKLLFKIVDKVKSELQRAGLETPTTLGSSSSL